MVGSSRVVTFVQGSAADGADHILGDGIVDYSLRTNPPTVTMDDVADDGEAGEGDSIASNVYGVLAGSGDDVLVGSPGPNRLRGESGNDDLYGGGERDFLYGGDGDDVNFNADGVAEHVECGGGIDDAEPDPVDTFLSCEL
jgi:Ca2+-binding RTX toxin-like protein